MNAVKEIKGIYLEFIIDGELKTATLVQRNGFVSVRSNIISSGDYFMNLENVEKIITNNLKKYKGRRNLRRREYKTEEEVLKTLTNKSY